MERIDWSGKCKHGGTQDSISTDPNGEEQVTLDTFKAGLGLGMLALPRKKKLLLASCSMLSQLRKRAL